MAYDVANLVSKIQRKAKDTSLSSTLITDFLDEAQQEILGDQFSQFLEETESPTPTLASGQTTRAYPADHQATIRIWLIDPDTDQVLPVLFLPHEVFFKQYPSPADYSQNLPAHWTDYGGVIQWSCPLNKNYDLKHQYIRVPGTLASSSDVPDIPEEFQYILVNGGMAKVEEYRDNFDMAAVYQRKVEDLAEKMQIRYALRQYGPNNTVQAPWGVTSDDPWGE